MPRNTIPILLCDNVNIVGNYHSDLLKFWGKLSKADRPRNEAIIWNSELMYKLEAQGPCTGHRSSIAIFYCFSFKYMKREKGRDLTQYTNLCGLNTMPH